MSSVSLDVLACPLCHAALTFHAVGADGAPHAPALVCGACDRKFPVADDIPSLVQPDALAAQLAQVGAADLPYAERYDRTNRIWLLKHGLVAILRESGVRRPVVARLGLKSGDRLLETAVGTASNLEIVAEHGPPDVELHGTDVSAGMLRVARRKLAARGRALALTQANAEYLPYRDEAFDAVLHIGAMNQLTDPARALREMLRVARPGARIVISDEGLSPEKARTLHGRWILRQDPAFRSEPPRALLPACAGDVRVSWVLQQSFWVLECVKRA